MDQTELTDIPDDLQLISIPAFCSRVGGVNYHTAIKWIERGKLKSIKVGERRMIPLYELQRVCKEGLAIN